MFKLFHFCQAASGEVSIENAERTIASLTDTLKSESLLTSSDQLIPLNLLQQLSVLLEALASLMPTVSQLESSKSTESQSVLKHCRNIFDMSCICELQIRIISGNSQYHSNFHSL